MSFYSLITRETEEYMKTKLFKKALLVVGVAVLVCGFALQASATSLTFTQSSGFQVGHYDGTMVVPAGSLKSTDGTTPYNDIKWYSDATAPVDEPIGYYNTVAWGGNQTTVNNNNGILLTSNPWGNTDYSGLKVIGFNSPQVTVGDPNGAAISRIYHQNNAINGNYFTLTNATVRSLLTMGTTDDHSMAITFNETPNTAGSCTNTLGAPCADSWGFKVEGFDPVLFTYGGAQYWASFYLGNPLSTGAYAPVLIYSPGTDPAGWTDGTIWTAEGSTSSFDVFMVVTAAPVPEPATLTLLGLGLLGLGLARRRRKG
jgi:hypothetical protein